MRYSLALAALSAAAQAVIIPLINGTTTTDTEGQQLFTLSLGINDVRVVTEDKKWALKDAGINFFDITEEGSTPPIITRRSIFPSSLQQTNAVKSLIPSLSKEKLQSTLTTFANFHNRYYNANYGKQSATWLKRQVDNIISTAAPKANVSSKFFTHSWTQPSVIVTILGKSNKHIVIGAHQDSISSGWSRASARAPGADDNGSGSMTILEAFRVILEDKKVAAGEAENTIEFHWYAGEEAGLLGSQAVFNNYARNNVDIAAMLNQDMTGWVSPESEAHVGVFVDYTDSGLTTFLKTVIDEYVGIKWRESECGYACSDHSSADKVRFPAAMASEGVFEETSPYIHAATDTLDRVSYNHMLEFTKLTLEFAYELCFHAF